MYGTLKLEIFEPEEPPADPVQAELANDVWDIRNIPGVRFHLHRSEHLLNFEKVRVPFRPLVKQFLAFQVTHASFSTCRYYLQYLPRFVDFFNDRYPGIDHFRDLKRSDIEAFLIFLRGTKIKDGKDASQNHVSRMMHVLKAFLEHLERSSASEGPTTSVNKLIWPDDVGKNPQRTTSNTIKFIPESVLQQLDQHIEHMLPHHQPVVILLRASGWRIADVLNLRVEKCLERTSSGWWLCGDITKTQVLNHRVPITDEIAEVVRRQKALVQSLFAKDCYLLERGRGFKLLGGQRHRPLTPADRKNGYLFPATSPERAGRPLSSAQITRSLNNVAHERGIKDDTGKPFHFNVHAFRHTKGVELINNGMNLLHVQKWLAHTSPEMTVTYAQVLDPTMREQWEKAFAQGAVRIDQTGGAVGVAPETFDEDKIEWEHIRHNLDAVRLPNGYCFKPKKMDCPTQAIPCHTCSQFCTTPEFLPQFERMKDETQELIQLGVRAGHKQWVERNQQNLDNIVPIVEILRAGKLHHLAGKTVRENTTPKKEPDAA